MFVPRRGLGIEVEEGDGVLLVLVSNYEGMGSELHLMDTRDFTRARAVILLPVRLRPGLHALV